MKKKYYIFEIKSGFLTIVCLIFAVIACFFTRLFYPLDFVWIFDSAFFVYAMLLIFVIHEILHSLSYVLYGANFKCIVYGAVLEKGVFYCLCKQKITRKNILNSLLFPFFYLSVIPYIIGLIFHLDIIILLAIVNFSGCVGDIYMFNFIRKLNKDIQFTEFDNPIRFAIYADYDVSKVKYTGLKFVQTADHVEQKDLTKVKISTFSWAFMFFFLLLFIIDSILYFIP